MPLALSSTHRRTPASSFVRFAEGYGKLALKFTANYSGVAKRLREKKTLRPMGQGVDVSGALVQPGINSADGLPTLRRSSSVPGGDS